MNADDLFNLVAHDLPPGWRVVIDLENGYGAVQLFENADPNGDPVVFNFEDGTKFSDRLADMLLYARDKQRETDASAGFKLKGE